LAGAPFDDARVGQERGLDLERLPVGVAVQDRRVEVVTLGPQAPASGTAAASVNAAKPVLAIQRCQRISRPLPSCSQIGADGMARR